MTMKQIADEFVELDHIAIDLDIRSSHFFRLKWNIEIQKYIDFKCNILKNILFAQKSKIVDIIERGELHAVTNIGFSYKAIENYDICWRYCLMAVLDEMTNRGCWSTIDIYDKFANDPLNIVFLKKPQFLLQLMQTSTRKIISMILFNS